MKKFRVVLKETVLYFADIEAETLKEAANKGTVLYAEEKFPNGLQELHSAEITAYGDDDKFKMTLDPDFIEELKA